MKDLRIFLATGQSPEYDSEKILGPMEIQRRRRRQRGAPPQAQHGGQGIAGGQAATSPPLIEKISFVAMTDHRALLKSVPQLRPACRRGSLAATQNLEGKWDNQGGQYQLSMSPAGSRNSPPPSKAIASPSTQGKE